jgi:hypothetical protein
MHPEEWRPVKAVEVSGHQGGPVEVGYNSAVVEGISKRVAETKRRRQAQNDLPGRPADDLAAG